jgi:fructose/tagatose bisphosphate aldolase
VGTVHGVYKGAPKIDLDRLDLIRDAVDIPLVLHGSSGLPDSEIQSAVEHGIGKINYFTQLSLAGTAGIRKVLDAVGNKRVNYIDLHDAALEASKACVKEQLRLFGTQRLDTTQSL